MSVGKWSAMYGGWMVAACLTFAGCGSSEGGVQLSGAVTFQGQPVPAGEIVFTPKSGDQPSAAGKIEQGKFKCQVPAGPSIVGQERRRAVHRQLVDVRGELVVRS
jgi:hypothetical protein